MMRAPSPLLEHSPLGEVWVMDADGSERAAADDATRSPKATSLISPDGTTVVVHGGRQRASSRATTTTRSSCVPRPVAAAPRMLLPDAAYEVSRPLVGERRQEPVFLRQHGRAQPAVAAGRRVEAGRRRSPRAITASAAGATSESADVARLHAQHARRARARSTRWPAAEAPSRKRVTDVFDYVDSEFKIARQERITWKGQDGAAGRGPALLSGRLQAGSALPADRLRRTAARRHPTSSGSAATCRSMPARATRCCKPELSRQHGLRRRVPARHGQGLLQAGAPRRDDRHRRGDRDGRGRSRQAGEDGMERRRPHDEQDHHLHRSLQGGQQRRGRGELDLDVRAERSPRVPDAVVRRHAVAGERADRPVLEPLAAEGRGEGEDADDLPGRRSRIRACRCRSRWRCIARSSTTACRRSCTSRRARATAGPSCGIGCSSCQIEMEWFEKWVNNRTYVWEKAPGEQEKEPMKNDDSRSRRGRQGQAGLAGRKFASPQSLKSRYLPTTCPPAQLSAGRFEPVSGHVIRLRNFSQGQLQWIRDMPGTVPVLIPPGGECAESMPQVFPKSANAWSRASLVGVLFLVQASAGSS